MTRASTSTGKGPEILESAGPLLSKYSVIFCDVWGVAHDGHRAFPGANNALKRFREQGGVVIMVSNAPVPGTRVAEMLDRVGFWRSAWDNIVSSGDIALKHISKKGYRRLFCIGPYDRDKTFFDNLPSPKAATLDQADAIVCTGLNDDVHEQPNDYQALLERALKQGLPFVCANPDLVVDVSGVQYFCAGAIADIYEEAGGDVYWAGKPHSSAFETALRVAESVRGRKVSLNDMIAIGDGLRTDLKAAQQFGVDAIFVADGIHRDEAMIDGQIKPDLVAKLFSGEAPPAIAAMARLKW